MVRRINLELKVTLSMAEPILPDFPDHFETERLFLRAPRSGDGEVVNAAIHDSFDKLNRWMEWARHMPSFAETETHAREAAARFRAREELGLWLFRKSDGMFVGASGLHSIDWSVPRFEIGYWLRTSMEGHGYMTEAVNGITRFAFTILHAARVEIHCDALNHQSAAVAERAGYTLEARLHHHRRNMDGELADTLIFSKFPDV
jgi:RimJ/RimL family protein N-acetyltransferase